MALTLEELKRLMAAEGLGYFVDPNRPVVMCGARGLNAFYEFTVSLDLNGEFLQFRTMRYLHCPADSPRAEVVHKVLLDLNYQLRFVKYAWDSSDGEIVVYADVWLMDGTLTEKQFGRALANFVSSLDLHYPRVSKAISEGADVGLQTQTPLPPHLPEGIREKLRKLLEALGKRGGAEPATSDDVQEI